MKVKGSQAERGFWLGWVLASAIGMGVGFMMMFFIAALMSELPGAESLDIEWLFNLFAGIMLGVGVGILQWLSLRRRVSGVGWWVLASAAAGYGYFVAAFIGILESLSLGLFLRFTGVAALGGAVTGILQWFILRGKVSRAGWWVLASTVGWALGMAVSRAIPWRGDTELLALVVAAAVMGVVTGGALDWLLRQPVPEA